MAAIWSVDVGSAHNMTVLERTSHKNIDIQFSVQLFYKNFVRNFIKMDNHFQTVAQDVLLDILFTVQFNRSTIFVDFGWYKMYILFTNQVFLCY
jgi:hypothetical protein